MYTVELQRRIIMLLAINIFVRRTDNPRVALYTFVSGLPGQI